MRLVECLLVIAFTIFLVDAQDIICKKKMKAKVKIGTGDSFSFRTQAGATYAPNTKCRVTYKKLSSCPLVRFSCSEFNINNKKSSCKGKDKMVVKFEGKSKSFCQTEGPDITTSGNLVVSFLSNKNKQSSGAVCSVECDDTITTTTDTTTDTTPDTTTDTTTVDTTTTTTTTGFNLYLKI